jgi:hypothetical protein
MHLISASRRTDLPAFYSLWFMRRLRAGSASWIHPYSSKLLSVSLDPGEVAAIVFWTRNFAPMLPHLDELEGRGYRYLVQFTLTGLPRIYESHVPSARAALKQMEGLARRVGPERLLWRYDPILVSEGADLEFHRQNFSRLARALEGVTRQCTISFMEVYGKIRKNFRRESLPLPSPTLEERCRLASDLAQTAARHGIALRSCCGDELVGEGVEKARCVDPEQVMRLWPELRFEASAAPTREERGCGQSFDIGAYDTCVHGCRYCYATKDRETAKARRATHTPDDPALLPATPKAS